MTLADIPTIVLALWMLIVILFVLIFIFGICALIWDAIWWFLDRIDRWIL